MNYSVAELASIANKALLSRSFTIMQDTLKLVEQAMHDKQNCLYIEPLRKAASKLELKILRIQGVK